MSKLGIGIFEGKKAKYNKLILRVLYDNGPLTQWGIAKTIYRKSCEKTDEGKQTAKDVEYARTQMIQSTISRRLRALKKKRYVTKRDRAWIFLFKGIIANLLMQEKPKPWNEKWNKGIQRILEISRLDQFQHPVKYESDDIKLQISPKAIKQSYEKSLAFLEDFQEWIKIANATKKLMEKGVINFDIISNRTLITLLVCEDQDFFGLSDIFEG